MIHRPVSAGCQRRRGRNLVFLKRRRIVAQPPAADVHADRSNVSQLDIGQDFVNHDARNKEMVWRLRRIRARKADAGSAAVRQAALGHVRGLRSEADRIDQRPVGLRQTDGIATAPQLEVHVAGSLLEILIREKAPVSVPGDERERGDARVHQVRP